MKNKIKILGKVIKRKGTIIRETSIDKDGRIIKDVRHPVKVLGSFVYYLN